MGLDPRTSILLVDDEESFHLYVKTLLSGKYDLLSARDSAQAMEIVTQRPIDLVLLDLILEDGHDGLTLLKQLKQKNEDLDVIIVSGIKMVHSVVEAIKLGASDYINKPFEREELLLAIGRVLEKRSLVQKNQQLQEELDTHGEDDPIIGQSEPVQEIKRTIARLKNQAVNVFLVGDTGTGKEMFARRLHDQESGSNRPFVSVNCAAIPENLMESVLFGHERGAFTGATERRLGKFELANGGDIFLDEITCLPTDLQAKLLRVLEEKEVERIGSSAPKKITFRVISAANENILRKVAQAEFRSDLFYRLNTVTIQLPNLSQRKEDITLLAEHFLKKYRRTPRPKILSDEVKEILTNHQWRGNVRELRNTIENMIIFSKGDVIEPQDIPFLKNGHSVQMEDRRKAPRPPEGAVSAGAPIPEPHVTIEGNYEEALQKFEKDIILKKLEKNRWSKTRTCKDLGITRNKLYRKMAELGIDL